MVSIENYRSHSSLRDDHTSKLADKVKSQCQTKSISNDTEKEDRTKEIWKYYCEVCNESFKRKDKLDRHVFTHTKQKTFCCDFDGCSKKYTNKSHLNRHKKSSHEAKPEIASVTCRHPNCYQSFTNKSNMNRHYQTHHIVMLPYSCGICSEKFRRKMQLKKHEIKEHTGNYAYTCESCNKGFLNQFTYFRHRTTHKIQNPCPDCDLVFLKWSALVEHRRKVHKGVPRFSCDICGKTFCRKPNLKEHMSLHLLNEENVFQCTYENCSKFYTVKRNLNSHIRSKHEGKRWTCDICKRQLSSFQKLKQHISAHLEGRAQLLLKKTTAMSKLMGFKLPNDVDQQILEGKGSQVNIESILPPIESTTETSGAEFSDF